MMSLTCLLESSVYSPKNFGQLCGRTFATISANSGHDSDPHQAPWRLQHLNRRIAMLDHVFLSVSDIERSIAFYVQALAPLGIADRVDYDGKDGPPGHPDLRGFGRKGRIFFWLRLGVVDSRAAHVGFLAKSRAGGGRE